MFGVYSVFCVFYVWCVVYVCCVCFHFFSLSFHFLLFHRLSFLFISFSSFLFLLGRAFGTVLGWIMGLD
jgi:hypothetical protein